MNKKKKLLIVPIIIIILGLSLVLYPFAGNICNYINATTTINQYKEQVNSLTKEEINEIKEKAQKYNNTNNNSSGYYDALNLGEVISYIDIPKISVYLPVYNNTKDDTLQKGIGHLEHTSLPIGGIGTHCVLTGHSGLTTSKMFSDLEQLKTGDEFKLHTLDEVLTYQVDNIEIALPEDVSDYLTIDNEHDYVTLMTCTPIGVNTHRLLVRGTFIGKEKINSVSTQMTLNEETNIKPANKKITDNNFIIMYPLIVIIVFAFILSVLIIYRKVRKKRK